MNETGRQYFPETDIEKWKQYMHTSPPPKDVRWLKTFPAVEPPEELRPCEHEPIHIPPTQP